MRCDKCDTATAEEIKKSGHKCIPETEDVCCFPPKQCGHCLNEQAIRADERAKFAKSHVAEIEQQLRDGLGLEYANKGYQKALNDVLELGKKEILGCNETHDEDTASTIWWFLEKIKALQGGKT